MSFINHMFASKKTKSDVPDTTFSDADVFVAQLQCPMQRLKKPVSAIDLESIWESYMNALTQGKQDGFTPLLLLLDDLLIESIQESISETASELPMAMPVLPDGKAWLDCQYALCMEELRKCHISTAEFESKNIDDEIDGQRRFLSIRSLLAAETPIYLAGIPTKNPWEILRWVPFGGWNECPMPAEMMAVLRYWHEKYGAVPACVGADTLELYVQHPVSAEQALELAKEQYAFCTDIVDQGVGSVGALAKQLQTSTVWYFWWD